MKLTDNQKRVLDTLREISRANVVRYREKTPYLYEQDCKKLSAGDQACAFGLGGLSYQVGARLNLAAASVLSTFKALERKGLVLREASYPEYQRPRYWWPVGLAAEMAAELLPSNEEAQ
ncbi:hypothetical protein [Pseudomonas guariconensis]|uniref:MarR family transcriptional regulator n=1 Tax=Pseudomonas guariconensis TaxID=1288410 RepID=A0AAX0VNY1_9PSED|nr:hypothetical protein [Pseudomonas guariconensis]PLV10945.1 hypothetical protein CXG49_25960 [Pseudomonas guariconensis]PLV20260.1 hypothetical protein CXG53_25950 [Pseudomonas guariconensis]PLV26402.1 hypothetical protein CXG51_25950 [Pseudomonas guariconensis]